jgi:inner membrane protein
LGRRTSLGTSALLIGANLPDLDALAYLSGPLADLEWRRGWTHGILALIVLPFLLTGTLTLAHRIRSAHRFGRGAAPDPKQLLLLSTLAILSHPALDTLNTYGVRWLMPFSGTWYYGDALFIVDPWVWLMLAAGLLWARRQRRELRGTRAARLALGTFLFYAALMWLTGAAARARIAHALESRLGLPVGTVMAGPLPLTVLTRSFVAEQQDNYLVGTFRWWAQPKVQGTIQRFPRGRPSHPAYAVAESTLVLQRFLGWARFPTFMIESAGNNQYLVHAVDLRYARQPGDRFGALTIPVALKSGLDVGAQNSTYCIQNTKYEGPCDHP